MISHPVGGKRLTLFALIFLHHVRLARSSSSLSMLPLPCAEHWLLIFLASWGAGPSLAPFPQADPISLRSQATAHSHVGYKSSVLYKNCLQGRFANSIHKNSLQGWSIRTECKDSLQRVSARIAYKDCLYGQSIVLSSKIISTDYSYL